MSECCLCNGEANIFSKQSLRGKVCGNCYSYISPWVDIKVTEPDILRKIRDDNIEKFKEFEVTSSYGTVYADEIHNIFCISNKEKKGKPAEYNNIHRISELKEISLFCTDLKKISDNDIKCNIKLRIITKDIFGDIKNVAPLSGEFPVKSNESFLREEVGNKILYSEPLLLCAFRSVIDQMIENEYIASREKLKRIAEFDNILLEMGKNYARGILFLDRDSDFSADILKERRNFLIKIFHPDRNTDFADTAITALINDAYNTLSESV